MSRTLGREVQVVFRSPRIWESASDTFTRSARQLPVVELDLAAEELQGAGCPARTECDGCSTSAVSSQYPLTAPRPRPCWRQLSATRTVPSPLPTATPTGPTRRCTTPPARVSPHSCKHRGCVRPAAAVTSRGTSSSRCSSPIHRRGRPSGRSPGCAPPASVEYDPVSPVYADDVRADHAAATRLHAMAASLSRADAVPGLTVAHTGGARLGDRSRGGRLDVQGPPLAGSVAHHLGGRHFSTPSWSSSRIEQSSVEPVFGRPSVPTRGRGWPVSLPVEPERVCWERTRACPTGCWPAGARSASPGRRHRWRCSRWCRVPRTGARGSRRPPVPPTRQRRRGRPAPGLTTPSSGIGAAGRSAAVIDLSRPVQGERELPRCLTSA